MSDLYLLQNFIYCLSHKCVGTFRKVPASFSKGTVEDFVRKPNSSSVDDTYRHWTMNCNHRLVVAVILLVLIATVVFLYYPSHKLLILPMTAKKLFDATIWGTLVACYFHPNLLLRQRYLGCSCSCFVFLLSLVKRPVGRILWIMLVSVRCCSSSSQEEAKWLQASSWRT